MKSELTRRRFMATAGLGAAGAAHGSLMAGPPPEQSSPRRFYPLLSLSRLGFKGTFQESVDLAVRHGFEGVVPDAEYFAQLSSDDLKKLLDDLKAKNLRLGAAAFPVTFRRDEQTFSDDLKKLPSIAKVLQAAGVNGYSTAISPLSNDLTYLQNFRLHACRLHACAAVLADYGQRIGMEYVAPKTLWRAGRHPFIHTMSEMKELIVAIGGGNLALHLDSWHWFNAEETQADLETLRDQDVVSVDLNDAPAGVPLDKLKDNERELPAATGVIPIKAFLDGLRMMGYTGPVHAEPFNAALRAMPIDQACGAAAAAIKKAFALAGTT